MKKLFLLLAVVIVAYACSKDSSGDGKPSIAFRSYNMSEIPNPAPPIVVYLNLKDSDGDIEDRLFVRLNYFSDGGDTITYNFEPFNLPKLGSYRGSNINATIEFRPNDTYLNPKENMPLDSVWFSMYVQDNAGNISDTIATPRILIHGE
ncbi:hypothetical protein LX64_02274 [Chitinophaga skermanii]|uniref:Uncharacterized protein n=1 Tax=Chitinophaga skermanii TaxID=331697 RepID=A0A327QLE6_9BACT|nr:hypothetical protein [Chitinophaga skermanii]RAJ05120.1 hypothetical protein LX64_02274 [Chitinophaga skermanii]